MPAPLCVHKSALLWLQLKFFFARNELRNLPPREPVRLEWRETSTSSTHRHQLAWRISAAPSTPRKAERGKHQKCGSTDLISRCARPVKSHASSHKSQGQRPSLLHKSGINCKKANSTAAAGPRSKSLDANSNVLISPHAVPSREVIWTAFDGSSHSDLTVGMEWLDARSRLSN